MNPRRPRRGIETALLRREQGLRSLRMYFAEHVADNLDEAVRRKAVAALILSMEFHIDSCRVLVSDIVDYEPKQFDVKTRSFVPLTREGLVTRKRVGEARAKAHADEAKKKKSRREKNT